MKKYKILLIDNNNNRRMQITSLLNCHNDCCVDPRGEISKHDLEQGSYDVIIVHLGNNPEHGCIENEEWDTGRAKVVSFSGGHSQLESSYEDILYVRPDYFESKDNVRKLLKGASAV